MKFALALLIAVHFWSDRNVHVPCHPVAVEHADAQMPLDPAITIAPVPVWMAATTDCRILISNGADVDLADTTDPLAAASYCSRVVHEVGHLAGLDHTATGIMSPVDRPEDIPYNCRHWRAFRRNR